MSEKAGCKKCGSQDSDFQEIKKGEKFAYYIKCKNCGNLHKANLKKIAKFYYDQLCAYETNLVCKDIPQSPMYNRKAHNVRVKIKSDNKYIFENLVLLFQFIYRNNLQRKFELQFSRMDLIAVIKKHKEPLTDEKCLFVFNDLDELLKKRKEESDKNK